MINYLTFHVSCANQSINQSNLVYSVISIEPTLILFFFSLINFSIKRRLSANEFIQTVQSNLQECKNGLVVIMTVGIKVENE